MSRVVRGRRIAPVILAFLIAIPAPATAAGSVTPVPPPPADLAAALAPDGTFVGAPGLAGTVDAAGWLLVSDLAAGEPPRFARASGRRERGRARPAGTGGWESVGSVSSLNGEVLALAARPAKLYLGGAFFSIPGAPSADSLASWDGSDFASVGSANNVLGDSVLAIAIDGTDLYVGGAFLNAAGIASADRVARWEGSTSTWESMGGSLNATVRALAVDGADVYVGGDFVNADGKAKADYLARWNGGTWTALGQSPSGSDGALSGKVNALAVDGGDLYAGGLFTNVAGEARADYVARWDGGTWRRMGANLAGTDGALNAEVFVLLRVGTELYVGGEFEDAAGASERDYLARWSGGAWGSVGANAALTARVYALAAVGEDLYVGGHFLNAAGIAEADRVVRWDGSDWHALGSNGAGNGAIGDTVYALAAYGGYLHVGGVFEDAAGISGADHIARFPLEPVYRPDARVRQGTRGSLVGGEIYNTTAVGQSLTTVRVGRGTVVFQVSLQNDSGALTDAFRVQATGAANGDFVVTYLQGSTDITAAVEAGTWISADVAPDSDRKMKVRIRIRRSASVGERLVRKITITSQGDPSRADAVEVTAERG